MKRALAILALVAAPLFAAVCWCAAQPIGPTTSPAPVDPSAAVAAIQQLANAANGSIAALNAQHAADQATIAGLQQQVQGSSQAQKQAASRPAASHGWLGMNSSANLVDAYCRWADASHSASGFYDASGGTLKFTYSPHGYPVGAAIRAQSNLDLLGCPAGDYNVSWKGNAAVTISVYGGSYKSTGPNSGVMTLPAPCVWTQNQWGLNPSEPATITVTSSDPANPLDALHIWTPGYGPGSAHDGQMYRDEDLELCRHFACIRAMNDLQTGSIVAGKWANRVTLDQWDWTSFTVPLEAVIRRAQESGVTTLWVSVPAEAGDDTIQGMAQLLHDRFHGRVIVESANEYWNQGGMIGNVVLAGIASAKGTNPGAYDGTIVNGKWHPSPNGQFITDDYTREARCAGDICSHVAKVFQQVYADRPTDCWPVFCGCSADPRWIDLALTFLVARDGAHPFKLIGIAPYAIDPWAASGKYYKQAGASPTLADLFASCAAYMADPNPPGVPWQLAQAQSQARQFGVQLVDYEGGQTWYPQDKPYDGKDLSTAAQTDPRMGAMYDAYFALLHQYPVALHCDFVPIGEPWNQNGYWAALNGGYAEEATSVRWASLMRESAKSN